MEGGAALGYMVAICHGYSHQTDQPCPALNIQYFHFLCHLFWRILSHSNWRINWGLWFDLIHLSIEGMSELRVFNQLVPGYSTLDWIFKNKINLPSLPRQEPTRMWTPLDYPLPWINITVNFGFEEKKSIPMIFVLKQKAMMTVTSQTKTTPSPSLTWKGKIENNRRSSSWKDGLLKEITTQ